MPAREDVHYFGAGPAPLPTPVLEEASKVLLNYKDTGIGITEISHRSGDANEVLANAQKALRELLNIPESDGPDGYQILFLQGGGSGEFSAVVYNLVSVWIAKQLKALDGDEEKLAQVVKEQLKLDYLVTGSWSLKASQEAARLVGGEHVNIVTDARKHRDGKFGVIPEASSWTASGGEPALTYYCDNETVDGVEFQSTPTGKNLVADLSSNFLSRPVDVRKHAVIFGGAQKNIGTTGVTIAIVSNAFLAPHAEYAKPEVLRKLGLPIGPVVFDYPTIAKNNSLYNTLPIFDVWIAGQVMQRLLTLHKASEGQQRIAGQADESNQKAQLLYGALDSNETVYQVVPDKTVRSRMNICFRVKNGEADVEKAFLKGAEERGLMGLKGHRSVGGIRISNYNAVPVSAAEKLAKYLQEFAKENA
ncbi:Putative aminotransferase class V domain, pyridoxal phosphate-dependent transferase, major [Septoria linicola]|uniref:phosphoserine transaminase n=1 Tax=Septoria linicola TaxID=215465 RepID=A0A9Q9EKA4_9PEZI|nr:Putative aminotransferase class V domain, pyridoxal phosphate-dependent transferase, major [Septoria linicola]